MSKGRQDERVLAYMLETGGITSWEAIREIGCTRLSARIYRLRKAGWEIDSEPVARVNRWGDRVTFRRYFVRQSLQPGQAPASSNDCRSKEQNSL